MIIKVMKQQPPGERLQPRRPPACAHSGINPTKLLVFYVFDKNAGFCSIVAEMNPLNAAHRFEVADCSCTAV